MMTYRGVVKDLPRRKFIISSIVSEEMDPDIINNKLLDRYEEYNECNHSIYSLRTASGSLSTLKPQQLAHTWNIGIETECRTLKVTTRMCPRNTENISLNKRYPQNDRMLRYKHIDTNIFTDTMFASKRIGKSYR